MTTAQVGGKVVSLTHRPPLSPGNAPGTHFYWRLSRPQSRSAIARILCQWKIPITPAGIESAAFQFVAQHLNHCATAVPAYLYISSQKHSILGLCALLPWKIDKWRQTMELDILFCGPECQVWFQIFPVNFFEFDRHHCMDRQQVSPFFCVYKLFNGTALPEAVTVPH